MLAEYGAKGTFFVNGNNYGCIYSEDNEARLKNAYGAGHQIASHTWAHLDWATLSNDQLLSQMTMTDDALIKILGVKPAFVRPPYGSYTAASLDVAGENGQSVVTWDFDSRDSDGATADQSDALYQNLVNSHPSSILTLNHETYASTVNEVLPFALQVLVQAGYRFVTVAECLGMDPYLSVGAPQARDVSYLDLLIAAQVPRPTPHASAQPAKINS
ncbi:Carbohydrate esterase 4 protein [Tulasnella sp. 427]|nr:Carbohydrate esterase 4 protein [Tulasnella sp. 427]